MSSSWHWFIVIGVVASLIAMVWLLIGNRKVSTQKTTGHVWDGIEELDTPLPYWWVGLFIGSIIFAVGYVILYPGFGNYQGLMNWSAQIQHDEQQAQHTERFAPVYEHLAQLDPEAFAASNQARQVGRRLYLNHCSNCHGIGALGTTGIPNLTDQDWLWGNDLAQIDHSIRRGRKGQMPAWGHVLGDDGVTAVTQYVLQLSGQEHDAQQAETGATSYQTFCVACHGVTGDGNTLLGAPALNDATWMHGNSIADIEQSIATGRTATMPAHAEIISDEKIKILAAYVKSLPQ